jgi:hypothetical protein
MLGGFLKTIRDGLDPNNVHELYLPPQDPDSQCIENLERTILKYTNDIDRMTNEKRSESNKIAQIKKRIGPTAINSPAHVALKKEALPHLRRIEQLDKLIDESTQKKANFMTLSENMKKQKRTKEEAILYREANVRMGIHQSEINTTELSSTITDARRLNQGVEKNGSILCAPISTENYNDHDADLLAQLDNFEDIDLGPNEYNEEINYYPTASTTTRRNNNNNNNNTVVNNV